eukprot:CAMPEP_0203640224 /NCGR_PEP_ID=MMETSP0088-20131115/5782_1 /ASSEMBLY_ACC=CAM_ASM_001087 /TAXON_ID=426623 /ORGANISM="Chaetoceros affinis, Strain CCMP159" /LENGTH=164 /DNA_ID=CAMNT_0050495345 /DNA_START=185 /DNA_END=676 /DNA_ORIENTATION=-
MVLEFPTKHRPSSSAPAFRSSSSVRNIALMMLVIPAPHPSTGNANCSKMSLDSSPPIPVAAHVGQAQTDEQPNSASVSADDDNGGVDDDDDNDVGNDGGDNLVFIYLYPNLEIERECQICASFVFAYDRSTCFKLCFSGSDSYANTVIPLTLILTLPSSLLSLW